MLEQLLQYDKELFLFLNTLGSSPWDGFWMFVTNKFNWTPLYILLLVLSFKHYGPKKTILVLVAVSLLVLSTDQLANFFKYGIQRLRPCYDAEVADLMRLVKDTCGGKYGYFSAHAGNHFAVAFFFTFLLRSKIPYVGVFLMVWASLVAYSRIYIGVHFPLDVLTGALFGLVLGQGFIQLYRYALRKLNL